MGALDAHGVILKRAGVALGDVKDVTGPTSEAGMEDVTTHTSTCKEYLAMLCDHGEVTFTILMNPGNTGHDGLRADLVARTLQSWTLVLPQGTNNTGTFSGYVQKYSQLGPVEGALKADVTIKISGAVSWA